MGTLRYKPKNKNIVKLKEYLDMNWYQNNTQNVDINYKPKNNEI
tara:strand:- start:294 stop:425 length:132 start_codon:yes stop_codon:yes gene_type:complete